MRIPSTYEAARSVEDSVLRELDRHGYDEVATFAVKLALEESLNNAITHGNRLDPDKTVEVDDDVTRPACPTRPLTRTSRSRADAASC